MPVCVECGVETAALYKEYSKGSIRLSTCNNCGNFVDKYVEYENLHIILDLSLQRIEAHRHLIYNRIPYLCSDHWRYLCFFAVFVGIFGGFVEYRYIVAPGSQISVSEFIFWATRSVLGSTRSPALLCCMAAFSRFALFIVLVTTFSYYIHRLGVMDSSMRSPRSESPVSQDSRSSTTHPSWKTLLKCLAISQYSYMGCLALIIWSSSNISVLIISTMFSIVSGALCVRAAIGERGERFLEAMFGIFDGKVYVFFTVVSLFLFCKWFTATLIVSGSIGWQSILFF
eukprot:GDKJ01023465.1.p1 GENE.GDKJ01023465.1~~GDKJ01023465.1.p1  ORF type:complete len:285 (+),score=-10.42 GDKJ01023465.1:15-869(+)